jgi:hypothetical protein
LQTVTAFARVRPLAAIGETASHGRRGAGVEGRLFGGHVLSGAADGAENHILAVANDLMQERPPDQFAPLVEFEVLARW